MSEYVPHVIVKLCNEVASSLPYQDGAQDALPSLERAAWNVMAGRFPGLQLTLDRALKNVNPGEMRRQLARNAAVNNSPSANLLGFFVVPATADTAAALAAALRQLPFVEHAEVSRPLSLPATQFQNDPFVVGQGYLGVALEGIGAIAMFDRRFADGAVTRFIDVEFGWQLEHEDLQDGNVPPITVLPTGVLSADASFIDHGTAVLGIVLGRDNDLGVIGIAPKVHGLVAPVLDSVGSWAVGAALAELLISVEAPEGTIVLIEQQAEGLLPVEIDALVRSAILELTRKGLVVVEAAGNGSADLDTFSDPIFGDIFNPDSGSFFDSSANMVASASSAAPHKRLAHSNYGKRVDCHAWGENILTCSSEVNALIGGPYQTTFGGTSGASAIVAGAAVVLQNIRRSVFGEFLDPAAMRDLLRDTTRHTLPHAADVGRIGVMPDLVQLEAVVTSP